MIKRQQSACCNYVIKSTLKCELYSLLNQIIKLFLYDQVILFVLNGFCFNLYLKNFHLHFVLKFFVECHKP